MYTEDLKPTDLNESNESINPSQLQVPTRPPRTSTFAPQNAIIEEESCLNRVSLSRAHETIELRSNFNFPPELETPTSSQKGQGKYVCTSCKRGFNRKGDWKRHEESHDPQNFWTCLLGEPAKLSATGWTCVFCNSFKANRSDMVAHLINEHKIHVCKMKKLEARTFYRKDKLKQHLQQVHALSENCSTLWESWHQKPKKKWAWGCGYCGGCSFTWEGTFISYLVLFSRLPITQFPHPPIYIPLMRVTYDKSSRLDIVSPTNIMPLFGSHPSKAVANEP
jgi:hypothetical protein